ncbi:MULTISPECIES: hypothetical protein [unclassified Paenibacillus]|uniref:VOC family protein n=1 Tax=unclassified Paenibacillus TaxID=185978 RepID=UPI002406CC7E|nr:MULTISPECIES: hypothetical protein [unclassified Paenibacillus]MDF9841724.1 putative lactoylglutathione lyase [Paenibacillus sp. PastF-2]MDF9848164.1 putative lactoylglutathione lyase [Paenibacillus sp. PastM-2]MDF9854883.1 putative lactoylglutathione lyase [Paenibacillus sp. PastF-1]MDH6480153.1 putative lactoylglutathione lyase [Paenibacillus sp. PastH-2]
MIYCPSHCDPVDTEKYAQMTIALAFESREKVDAIVNTAVFLGGKSYEEPEDYGFMFIGHSRTWTAICGQSTA